MASIGSDKGTRGTSWRVLIAVKSGGVTKRHTIRLGRVNRRIAETAKRMIESLEAAKATGHSLDGETANWVAAVSDEIHARLSRAGLVPPRQQAAAEATLGAHLAAVFATLGTQKKNTAASYQRARRLLEEFFGQDRLLAGVCPGDADDYKAWLLRKFSPATVSIDLRRAKQFFRLAVRRRLLTESPFADAKCGSQINESRREFVEQETIERVIAACPNHGWRMAFALPRYLATRMPSEAEKLKWSDVDWEKNVITIREPKVEHHAGRGIRIVPIFPELRPHLELAYRERPAGAVYIVPPAVGGKNLRTRATQIIKDAGIIPWKKTFANLRVSRLNELVRDRRFASHVITAWVGNSEKVRRDHYLLVTEADYQAALTGPTGNPAQIPAHSGPIRGHQEPSDPPDTSKKQLDFPKNKKPEDPRQESNPAMLAMRGNASRRLWPSRDGGGGIGERLRSARDETFAVPQPMRYGKPNELNTAGDGRRRNRRTFCGRTRRNVCGHSAATQPTLHAGQTRSSADPTARAAASLR